MKSALCAALASILVVGFSAQAKEEKPCPARSNAGLFSKTSFVASTAQKDRNNTAPTAQKGMDGTKRH